MSTDCSVVYKLHLYTGIPKFITYPVIMCNVKTGTSLFFDSQTQKKNMIHFI